MGKENLKTRRGQWTVEKQFKLYTLAKKYLNNHGKMPKGDWDIVATLIDAKSGSSCRHMFYENVRPDMEKKVENLEQENILSLPMEIPIQKNRTDFMTIINENNTLLKKLLALMKSDQNDTTLKSGE